MASAQPLTDSSPYAAFVPGTIPPRKLNGGLYTGEPFAGDWGNVPIVPDSGVILNRQEFLAYDQPVSWDRAGNNAPVHISSEVRFPEIMATFPQRPSKAASAAPEPKQHHK